MKNSINYQKGSSIVSDLKAVSSVITSRKTKVFLYGFVFSFVACTAYLAFFNPSGSTGFSTGVPWFNNLFSSAASSTAPYRSQISNFFSHFLPNSSSLSPPVEGIRVRRSGALVGGNGVTKEPGGDTRNKSVEELGFKPTRDRSSEKEKESTVGLQESGVSGKNKTGTESVGVALSNVTGTGDSTKNDGSLKQSESTTSTGTPPVVAGVPAKKDSNTKKQDGNGNHAASATPATQEVKKESGSKKDGNDEKNQKSSGNSSKNPTSNGSNGNSPAPTNLASTIPATSGGSGNQIRTATSPSGNESFKGQPKTAPNTNPSKNDDLIKSMIGCDMFRGQWVKDDSYPLYPEGSCPHIDEPFDCYRNGRPDRSYQKLRWQPHGCKIPRYKFD